LLNVTTERTRPTLWAATALLARVYLYMKDWTGADSAATALIAGGGYSLCSLNSVFLSNSTEAIWQLQPVTGQTQNTLEAILYIIPATGLNIANPISLSSSQMASFEPGDQRVGNWADSVVVNGVAYYYPYKYKINDPTAPISEYIMVMRLAEQYLIRAEAKTQEGNISAAQSDLNVVRGRASLPATTASTPSDMLTAVLHERQVEMFSEWGNRWLDLKRTGNVNAVMGTDGVCSQKGGVWNSDWQLYPIPLSDIQYDKNLVQNPDY
jgi:starch-binding outer membrane protein, SusD/RagB family